MQAGPPVPPIVDDLQRPPPEVALPSHKDPYDLPTLEVLVARKEELNAQSRRFKAMNSILSRTPPLKRLTDLIAAHFKVDEFREAMRNAVPSQKALQQTVVRTYIHHVGANGSLDLISSWLNSKQSLPLAPPPTNTDLVDLRLVKALHHSIPERIEDVSSVLLAVSTVVDRASVTPASGDFNLQDSGSMTRPRSQSWWTRLLASKKSARALRRSSAVENPEDLTSALNRMVLAQFARAQDILMEQSLPAALLVPASAYDGGSAGLKRLIGRLLKELFKTAIECLALNPSSPGPATTPRIPPRVVSDRTVAPAVSTFIAPTSSDDRSDLMADSPNPAPVVPEETKNKPLSPVEEADTVYEVMAEAMASRAQTPISSPLSTPISSPQQTPVTRARQSSTPVRTDSLQVPGPSPAVRRRSSLPVAPSEVAAVQDTYNNLINGLLQSGIPLANSPEPVDATSPVHHNQTTSPTPSAGNAFSIRSRSASLASGRKRSIRTPTGDLSDGEDDQAVSPTYTVPAPRPASLSKPKLSIDPPQRSPSGPLPPLSRSSSKYSINTPIIDDLRTPSPRSSPRTPSSSAPNFSQPSTPKQQQQHSRPQASPKPAAPSAAAGPNYSEHSLSQLNMLIAQAVASRTKTASSFETPIAEIKASLRGDLDDLRRSRVASKVRISLDEFEEKERAVRARHAAQMTALEAGRDRALSKFNSKIKILEQEAWTRFKVKPKYSAPKPSGPSTPSSRPPPSPSSRAGSGAGLRHSSSLPSLFPSRSPRAAPPPSDANSVVERKWWVQVQDLAGRTNAELTKAFDSHISDASLQSTPEAEHIATVVRAHLSKPSSSKTEEQLADEARYFGVNGDALLWRVSRRSFYERLGVTPFTASAAEIKRGYHRAVRVWHPDAVRKGGRRLFANEQSYTEMASSLFKLIDEAYKTLLEPAARAAYDLKLRRKLGRTGATANGQSYSSSFSSFRKGAHDTFG